MPRNMSFALTTEQFKNQTKDVTRRKGWRFLKPTHQVMGVEKGMGLKRGEKVKRLGLIRILKVNRERLCDITKEEVIREGFPNLTPTGFIMMYCRHNGGDVTQRVTRIEFEYM